MINQKYKAIYDNFISHYKNIHVNPWHEISERELLQIYNNLISSMDITDEFSFTYLMNYIIKRLSGSSDAHTFYDSLSLIPMNFRIFDNDVIINYPTNLKSSRLVSINDVNIAVIINELDNIITYGTSGKRKYELEKSLFNRNILFGLPSLRNFDKLIFKIETTDGKTLTKIFSKNRSTSEDELFDYDRYRYGDNATYIFIDNCLIYRHTSVQMKFKEKIEQAINRLKEENLCDIDTIIIDIRGNTGGNASLNKILVDFILEHRDKKLICLTDYRVFSAGRYALRDLINLGAITIGEKISTPINCYGNSKWIEIDGHYFSISECYFHPFMKWSAFSKEEFQKEVTEELLVPCIFMPQVLIEQTKKDYLQENDAILNYAIKYSKQNNKLNDIKM